MKYKVITKRTTTATLTYEIETDKVPTLKDLSIPDYEEYDHSMDEEKIINITKIRG